MKGGLHLFLLFHVLEFQNEAAPAGGIQDDEIAPAVAGLRLGQDAVALAGEEPVQDQVVAVLVVFVIERERRLKDLAQSLLCLLCLSRPEGILQILDKGVIGTILFTPV